MSDGDQLLRRVACDRCRGQKLRCERLLPGEHPTSSSPSRSSQASDAVCRRCYKAKAECITSNQLRPGRPRVTSSNRYADHIPQSQAPGAVPSRSPVALEQTMSMGANPAMFALVSDQHADAPSTASFDASAYFEDDAFFNPDSLPSLRSAPESMYDNAMNERLSPNFTFDALIDPVSWVPTPPSDGGVLETPILDRSAVCRQLGELCRTLSQDASNVLSSPDSAKKWFDGAAEDARTLVARSLNSAKLLHELLETFRCRESTAVAHQRTNPPTTANRVLLAGEVPDYGMEMIAALHMVTCFLCLRRIFRAILTRVLNVIKSGGASADELTLPEIHVEGLPYFDNGHLRSRLFVQVCLHVMMGFHSRLAQLAAEKSIQSPLLVAFAGQLSTGPEGNGSNDWMAQLVQADSHGLKELCADIINAIDHTRR